MCRMMNLLNKFEKKLNGLYSNKRFWVIALILAGMLVVFGYFLDRGFVTKEPPAKQEPKVEISREKGCAPTSQDVQGPYFRPNAPVRTSIVPPETKGESLTIFGTVYHSDCETSVTQLSSGVPIIEVWHADNTGEYDNTSPNYWYRGTVPVDSQGLYQFETIRPGSYLDGGGYRPAHIHFRVTVPGYRPLTTQLYFKDDPYMGSRDSCGPCNSEDPTLIVELKKETEEGTLREIWVGTFNIFLEPIEPQVSNTSTWQTYRNEEFGFEVRYYPESGPQENIGNETSGQFTYLFLVRFGTNPIKSTYGYELRVNKRQSLNSYREELVGHITDKIDSEEQIVINDNTWTKINYQIFLTTDYVPVTMVITDHGGYTYAITSSAVDTDQILSSFRFIE